MAASIHHERTPFMTDFSADASMFPSSRMDAAITDLESLFQKATGNKYCFSSCFYYDF